jgi:hypothetical protein
MAGGFLGITNAASPRSLQAEGAPSALTPAWLFDDPQQRTPPWTGGGFCVAGPLGREILLGQQSVAQGAELRVADAVELHPELKDGDRNEMRSIVVAARPQRHLALLEAFENQQNLLVRI